MFSAENNINKMEKVALPDEHACEPQEDARQPLVRVAINQPQCFIAYPQLLIINYYY